MAFQAFNVKPAGRGKARADARVFDSDEEELPAPQGAPPLAQTAAQLQEAGDRAAAAGSWGVAIQRWDAALAASPAEPHKLHEAKAQVWLEVWLEVGEDWKAVQSAQRAVELRPAWPEGHLTLSRAQLNLGEPELALESMERVLQLAPGHPEAAAEVVSIRTLVVQRRQGGGTEAGQRARVQRPAEGGSDCMES